MLPNNSNRVLRAVSQPPRSSERKIDDAWAKRRAQRTAHAVAQADTPAKIDQFLLVG
jgi:hypothetical protein